MLLLLDNYDSFVHNLARYFRRQDCETKVVRSDQIDPAGIAAMAPDGIVISPGPQTPDESGCCLKAIEHFADKLPMLGVCLGHQAIAQAFGAKIIQREPMHGTPSLIHHRGDGLFEGLPNPFRAGRYHSLAADAKTLPDDLAKTAWTQNDDEGDADCIMGIEHTQYPIFGVQFHPESILTECGDKIIANFLRRSGLVAGAASKVRA